MMKESNHCNVLKVWNRKQVFFLNNYFFIYFYKELLNANMKENVETIANKLFDIWNYILFVYF
jgi:hypothetical protein